MSVSSDFLNNRLATVIKARAFFISLIFNWFNYTIIFNKNQYDISQLNNKKRRYAFFYVLSLLMSLLFLFFQAY